MHLKIVTTKCEDNTKGYVWLPYLVSTRMLWGYAM